jgi:PIN domain nuclease of toxin-antitoxin system
MKYLLDTGVWIWSVQAPERIARKARTVLADLRQDVFLSAASSWEIAIKAAAGKLILPEPAASYVPRRMADQGLRPLPVTHQHALAVSALAPHHGDPFDRLLIAQANFEDLVLITADQAFTSYPVRLLWAGR